MTSAGSAGSGTTAIQAVGGGAVPTSALHILPISWYVARSFIREHHYLGRHTPIAGLHVSLGVFASDAFGAPMIGVMQFMRPTAANRMKDGESLLELRRMVILDITERNAESKCLGYAARYIKTNHTWVKALISYSDLEGQGHKGTIYKAAGWQFDGEAGGQGWDKHTRPGTSKRPVTHKLRWRKTL